MNLPIYRKEFLEQHTPALTMPLEMVGLAILPAIVMEERRPLRESEGDREK